MAFPTPENSTSQQFNTSSRTHDFDIPADWDGSNGNAPISSGDLLVLIWESFENASLTNEVPTGWTSLRFVFNDQQIMNSVYKSADGDEAGTTVTFAISDDPADTEAAGAVMIHFSGWSSIEDSGNLYDEANTTDVDPPAITPSWGADDNAYIVVGCQRDNNGTVSSWPTNYTDVQEEVNHGAGAEQDAMMAVAVRTVNNGTEDPGSFTFSTSSNVFAVTFAVQPAGGVTETASVSMGTYSLGLTDAGVATAGAVLTNNITYNITDAGQATAGASLTNDLTYGMTESGQATAGGDITVNISFGQTTAGSASAVGAISQAIAYGLTSSGTAITGVTSVSLSFGNSFDMSAAGTATAAASLSMDIQHALATAGQAVAAAGISLPYTLDISISASAITGDVTFADGRTLSISVDRRTKAIDSDSRTLGIDSENRTLPIEPND